MKKITLLLFVALCYMVFQSSLDGPLPENTGAPNEFTCGRQPCHNVPINVGPAQMDILFDGPGQQYAPDSLYLLTVRITNPQTMRNGFQILALNQNLQNTGSWQLLEPQKMKIISGIGLPNRKYVTHRAAGNLQQEWMVRWKAPAAAQGKITFYAAVNATNNDSTNMGDQVYTRKIDVLPLSPNGVEEASSSWFKVYPTIADSGFWVELPGSVEAPQISIFNAAGTCIHQALLPSADKPFFATDDFPPGVYFIKISAKDRQGIARIVIPQ